MLISSEKNAGHKLKKTDKVNPNKKIAEAENKVEQIFSHASEDDE